MQKELDRKNDTSLVRAKLTRPTPGIPTTRTEEAPSADQFERPAAGGTIVVLGTLSSEPAKLDAMVREFGWSFESLTSLEELRNLSAERSVVAILFEPRALGNAWADALQAVLEASPKAFPIVCQSFSETVPWEDLATAGAFHSLSIPLNFRELQQSLGFVWAATRQRGIPLHRPAPQRRRTTGIRRDQKPAVTPDAG
jgi:DNA-binding NtrC family response regulator